MVVFTGSPFKFATVQVTILAALIYAIIFISVLVFDELPSVPKNLHGLNLERGLGALGKITARPHPYISHANDDIRTYILSRLQPLADRHPYVSLSDDTFSIANYVAGGERVVSFEGTNVLLKIDGTDVAPDSTDGVLFSCHYDSVSTAPGATDDGMGVVTLLELAEYLVEPEKRPKRTAIIFFNNGEEEALNGAHAYFEHPWANLTSVFINLEGAASGGRPLVFRSTSLGPIESLRSPGVKHPHVNVLTSEAFSAGLIRSTTDYGIYKKGIEGGIPGLQGFDLAFYKNRAYYHTARDSIAGMGHGEAPKALWAMMELVRGAGEALLSDVKAGTDDQPGVYLDVLGRVLIWFTLKDFYYVNLAMLVVCPLVLIGLIAWVMFASKEYPAFNAMAEVRGSDRQAKVKFATKALAGWERFWIALLVGILVHVVLASAFVKLNPYIVHSHSYAVLTVFLAASFLALVLPLQVLHRIYPPTFVSQKLAVTLSVYSFSWFFMFVATVLMGTKNMGSLYISRPFNVFSWLASVIELVRAGRTGDLGNEVGKNSDLFSTRAERETHAEGAVAGRRLVRGVLHEAGAEGEVVETDPTEITPLIHQHRRVSQGGGEYVTLDSPDAVKVTKEPADEYGWWIAQMVLLVTAPALFSFQLELLLLNATMHTLVDGSKPIIVYAILGLFSVMVFIPITPFAHKLSRSLNAAVAVLLVILLADTWILFPFTQEWPFRVYFQQTVELGPVSTTFALNPSVVARSAPVLDVVRAETTVTGLKGYIDKYISKDIPSAWTADVVCDPNGIRPDLMTCKWPTDLLPSPGVNVSTPTSALDVQTMRLNASRVLVSLRGENTRGCRLYFDRPVDWVYVHPQGAHIPSKPSPVEKMRLQPGYGMPEGGVKEVRLWSRTWSRRFVVEVGWTDAEKAEGEGDLGGRAACEYAEYASGLGGAESGRIPAFEEVKLHLPLWALPTKANDGLAEVWTRFVA